MSGCLPRILIIDDLFGRTVADGENIDRSALCDWLRLRDVSSDKPSDAMEIDDAIAEAVFIRGQKPQCAKLGDVVENDLDSVLEAVRDGWDEDRLKAGTLPWSLILVDMCFYTGEVTKASESNPGLGPGMPEGRPADNKPHKYFGLQIQKAIHEFYNNSGDTDASAVEALDKQPVIIVLSSKSPEPIREQTESFLSRDFLPRDHEQLDQMLKERLDHYALKPDSTGRLLGTSRSWLVALRRIRQAAKEKRDILLLGESGTGKNVIAETIHNGFDQSGTQKKDKKGPFKQFNCAAISPTLIESELFGHKKGAFTGAEQEKIGYFEAANNGTLLLDEIGEMPLNMQIKLLHVLEGRCVTPVGTTIEKKIDVRVVAATNSDLEKAPKRKFRRDLFYRISPRLIRIPPLRERRNDIPLLVEKFLTDIKGDQKPEIDQNVFNTLQKYSWPGNIRELRACIEQSLNEFPWVSRLLPSHILLPKEYASQYPETKRQEPPLELSAPFETMGLKETLRNLAEKEDLSREELNDVLAPFGTLLARLIQEAMIAERDLTQLPEEGWSITRGINLLYGGKCFRTGPEPNRKLRRLLKILGEMNSAAIGDLGEKLPFEPFIGEGTNEPEN